MADIDNRILLLPAFIQTVEGGFNTGCETNTEVQMAHAGAPIDDGWKPGQPYSYSRAYTEYFDNLEKTLGKDLERTIKATMKWGMVAEKDWPTIKANQNKKPTVTDKATFPILSYEKFEGRSTTAKALFETIDQILEAGHIIGSLLELTEGAIKNVDEDGLLPNMDTPREYNHVVPMFGRVTKRKNPQWYGFRNHAGTEWGDNGDFYAHKSYLRRHKDHCKFYIIHFLP